MKHTIIVIDPLLLSLLLSLSLWSLSHRDDMDQDVWTKGSQENGNDSSFEDENLVRACGFNIVIIVVP